jgi:hypothetical protein
MLPTTPLTAAVVGEDRKSAMPFIPAPQRVVRCRAHWQQGAATAENVFYLSVGGAGGITTADCALVADQIAHAYNIAGGADVIDSLTNETSLVQIDVEEAAVQFGVHFSRVLSLPGRVTTEHAIAPGVALVVTLQTPNRGRSFRGRLFQIGAQESAVDQSGAVAPASLLVYQTAWNNWLAALADATSISAELGVNSYFTAHAPRAISLFTPVTSLLVRPFVHSQRRRNLG